MAKSTLPITPAVLSNSDFAKTFPFRNSDVTSKLRRKILKRTKHRKFWFSEAEELDKQRGTQLGTLGFLPWEIRQKIIELVFRKACEHFSFWVRAYRVALDCPPGMYIENAFPSRPHPSEIAYLRKTSASTKVEVEYYFLTQTEFGFKCPDALKNFLGNLTKYQRSLLRSFTFQLFEQRLCDNSNAENNDWIDACAQLPSGLTSIKFITCGRTLEWWVRFEAGSDSRTYNDFLGFLELLSNKIRRCWAPRAKLDTGEWLSWLKGKMSSMSSVPRLPYEVEEWSKEWLEWWESSQDGDQTEG